MAATKIVTCCYCGAHAALVLGGEQRHELRCGQCGAPLSRLKMLPIRADGAAGPTTPARHVRPTAGTQDIKNALKKARKVKKSKPLVRKVWGGVWDLIEDAFD